MVLTLVTLWVGFTAGLVCAALVRAGSDATRPTYTPRRRLTRVR